MLKFVSRARLNLSGDYEAQARRVSIAHGARIHNGRRAGAHS
jgi:hypothetical protein